MKLTSTHLFLALVCPGVSGTLLGSISKLFVSSENKLPKPLGGKFTAEEVKTIENAYIAMVVDPKMSDLKKLVQHDLDLQRVIKDHDSTIHLYDTFRLNRGKEENYKGLLKELHEEAFNRFPKFATSQEVLDFSKKRPEMVEYLVESKAFQNFIKSKGSLAEVTALMNAEQRAGVKVWDSVIPKLQSIVAYNKWKMEALDAKVLTNQEFKAYIANQENALKLFQNLRDRGAAPHKVLNTVMRSAFRDYVGPYSSAKSAAAALTFFNEQKSLKYLSDLDSFKAFLQDPFQAHLLILMIPAEKLKKESPVLIKQIETASIKAYPNQRAVLNSIARQNWDLTALYKFDKFQEFINHSNRAKLNGLVKEIKSHGNAVGDIKKNFKLGPEEIVRAGNGPLFLRLINVLEK